MSAENLIYLFETSRIMHGIAYFIGFNLAISLSDIIHDYVTTKSRDWRDSLANIFIYALKEALAKTPFAIVGVTGLYTTAQVQPWQIPMTYWTWAIAIITADFTYYWMHRCEHKFRFFWAYHSTHHSSKSYNLTTGYRLSLIEDLVEWIFLIPMVLIGFNLFQTIVAILIIALYQHWIHTEKINRLGKLDIWFNTPSTHRVHHGCNTEYLDKNYGGILMLWDHIFGTYQPEVATVQYGLTQQINSNNPVTIIFSEYSNLWQDIKDCQRWQDKIQIIFGRTGWKP
jgi:sterol desaturase/sphingolipid hydroxylase (fatty acid hydroxylase superfamily)